MGQSIDLHNYIYSIITSFQSNRVICFSLLVGVLEGFSLLLFTVLTRIAQEIKNYDASECGDQRGDQSCNYDGHFGFEMRD